MNTRKRKLGGLLPFSFISFCFCFGIGIGMFIRFGQLERSDAATTTIATTSTTEEYLPFPEVSPESVPPPVFEEPIPQETVTIKAVGDVIPGTNFPNYRLPRNKNYLIPNSVRRYLQGADIVFGNFESTLTNHRYTPKDISRGQVFAFRSPPNYAKLFADVGFNVFNMANNHAWDFGAVGYKDTILNFAAAGIQTVGHKNQILWGQINNTPVALIGFAPYPEFYNSIHDLERAKELVAQAKSRANIVIISMHAGAEGTSALYVKNKTEYFYGENRGNSIKFARAMIDAGADLVLGHGPHVPRAIEIYNGKLIAYSLGNFLGYRTLSTRAQTGYSMILEVELNQMGDLVASKIIPVRLNRKGIPYIDHHFRTVGLMRYLNNKAFPKNPVQINKLGEIVVQNSQPNRQDILSRNSQ